MVVRWMDNGVVNVASFLVGHGNVGSVTRWSESIKEHVEIKCPEVIVLCNENMGVVDKMDFMYFNQNQDKNEKVDSKNDFPHGHICKLELLAVVRKGREGRASGEKVHEGHACVSD